MKVGLVFAKIDFLRKMEVISNEHIGLGYIANSLEKNGINYEIIDGHFFDMDAQEIINWIEKGRFNVLGFSVLYSNYEETIKIINTIKKTIQPFLFIWEDNMFRFAPRIYCWKIKILMLYCWEKGSLLLLNLYKR